MNGGDVEAALAETVLDLEEAAGVAGGDDRGAGGGDVVDFALEKLVGHLGLDEVVDAGAAAAPHRFGEGLYLQAGNFAEQLAGLGSDFLAVAEVAGVVVGDRG